MTQLSSKINPNDPRFQTNAAYFTEKCAEFEALRQQIMGGASETAKARQRQYGKLLVRERIAALLDSSNDFFELSCFAGYQLEDTPLPAAGIITGIGMIHDRPCLIIANDPAVKGGTYYPITIKKHLRALQIALENQLPCIYLVDSGGAFLPKQAEVFPDREHFGRIFYYQSQLSARGIPQLAVVMGSCTAGGAYVPAMSDQVIMVRHQATIFLGGPPLVQAATGEKITAEALGGAEVHCRQSGVADYYAHDDSHALTLARSLMQYCDQRPPWGSQVQTGASSEDSSTSLTLPSEREYRLQNALELNPPKADPNDLMGIIDMDPRMPFDMREVLARLVDGSLFEEFKALYGSTLICGFAHIAGQPVGMIANNGILFSESALKGTHFVTLCSQLKLPIIFLQNITGFMVGKKAEAEGIAKHGAKLVHAVACSQVPKLTVIIGGSYGAGNYAMCGRAYDPRFLLMWPTARIAVMGGEQAAQVLGQLKSSSSSHQSNTNQDTHLNAIRDAYQEQSTAYYASARLWDDGIIHPLETRAVLAKLLRIVTYTEIPASQFGIFRM